MHKIFISYSYDNKSDFVSFDKKLKKFFYDTYGYKSYSFVLDFKKNLTTKKMMHEVFKKIKNSDIIILELSYKAIGIGVEAGYAKAIGKKLIYIHKNGSELSSTVDGIANARIEYNNFNHLLSSLKKVLF